jgi:putative salt-induced outer membrane protein YdiY
MIFGHIQPKNIAAWSAITALAWLLAIGSYSFVWAVDVIQLKNGDQVSGDILSMEDRVLTVETDYADIIKIDWDDVKGLISDEPIWVSFHEEAVIPEGVGIREGDRLIVFRLDPDSPVQLDKVKTINLFELSYRGTLSIGGSFTSGNTDTQATNASGILTINKGWHRIILDGRANRGKADGELTAKNGSLSARWDYFLTRRAYIPVINFSEYDQFQNLSYRSTSIVGGGYDVLDKRANFLTVSAGPTAIYENFSTEPSTITAGFSWLARWEMEFLQGDLKVWHNHIGTRNFGRGDAVRIYAVQGIRVEIYKDLSVNLEYNVRYNSEPAEDRKTTDSTIILGLSLDIQG